VTLVMSRAASPLKYIENLRVTITGGVFMDFD
jgi:hypothetical protein